MRALLLIAGALVAGAAAWCGLQPALALFVPEVRDALPAEPVVAAPAPASAALAPVEAPAPSCRVVDATVLLPDGSRIEALNGARGASPLRDAWPANEPWSPIVGIEHSPAGVDWWVHADGSRSTTEMVWRDDLRRFDAMTRLGRPTKVMAPAAASR